MDEHWRTVRFAQLESAELYAVLRLRQQVFAVEQNSVYLDLDNLDQHAVHMLYRPAGALAAYQRCLEPGLCYRESSIGRIVVDPSARGRQLGRQLVKRGIAYNLEQWPDTDIRINAQAHLQDFYTSLGFIAQGDVHMEDGIPHRHMVYSCSQAA